jgi:hypothetical protein
MTRPRRPKLYGGQACTPPAEGINEINFFDLQFLNKVTLR